MKYLYGRYIVHKLCNDRRTLIQKRWKCYIVKCFVKVNTFRGKEQGLTNYIGNRCFSEARRECYDGLITQTGIFL